jgi:hypothetical protein
MICSFLSLLGQSHIVPKQKGHSGAKQPVVRLIEIPALRRDCPRVGCNRITTSPLPCRKLRRRSRLILYSLTMPYTYSVAKTQAELPADQEAMTAFSRASEGFDKSVRELPQ